MAWSIWNAINTSQEWQYMMRRCRKLLLLFHIIIACSKTLTTASFFSFYFVFDNSYNLQFYEILFGHLSLWHDNSIVHECNSGVLSCGFCLYFQAVLVTGKSSSHQASYFLGHKPVLENHSFWNGEEIFAERQGFKPYASVRCTTLSCKTDGVLRNYRTIEFSWSLSVQWKSFLIHFLPKCSLFKKRIEDNVQLKLNVEWGMTSRLKCKNKSYLHWRFHT